MQYFSEHMALIPKPCMALGCGKVAVSRGRCETHAKEANKRHNESHWQYQTKDYKKARERALARCYYQCSHCGRADKLHVHHIDGDRRNNSDKNLIVLCAHCHMIYEKDIGDRHAAIHTTISEYVAYWSDRE